jgi:DNA polymerase elongation subunit (family B)
VIWRKISEEEGFADKGMMVGVKIDTRPGVVNCAMTGIMSVIQQLKNELQRVKSSGDAEELKRLKMMYQSVKGARNAGTHGILAAPNVSGRQFNLWGACAITTKGQVILDDTLNMLQKKDIRVTYGDTDGIYLGCSRTIAKIPDFASALGVKDIPQDIKWLTSPEDAVEAIQQCNKKWQEKLQYPEFELEPEFHDAMVFVKHKNYLIFDELNGKIQMNTKGNNFKGSDKANIARIALREIMMRVLQENPTWYDEEEARFNLRESIRRNTREIVSELDFSKVEIEDLTLIQSVKPARQYKRNQDGSLSTFGKRAKALEELLGDRIKSRGKYRFVITKKPLPGITNPSKSGVKPIDFMYPVDMLADKKQIDLDWYKEMIDNYIQGAFGLARIGETEQTGLDAWM